MDGADPLVLVVDEDVIVDSSVSLARLVGRDREDLRGAPLASLPLVDPLSSGGLLLRGTDGKVHELRSASAALPDATVRVWVARTAMRAELHERLMLADRMAAVGTLAAGVAHEINNPLAMVLANLELLGDELARASVADPDRARMSERVSAAMTATERVQRIVSDLRTFSRYDTGEEQPVDAAALLATTARLMEKELRNRARLRLELDSAPMILANPAQLGQVYLNLLQNAAMAIPDGEPERHVITASCRVADGQAEIIISDDGHGMDDETRRRAFEPFFTTRPVGAGTGLGLSYCHNVVTGLGGRMHIESHPGMGTRARLLVPTLALPAELGRDEIVTPVETSDARLRILVIDDEPEIGELIAALLHEHRVQACTDGEDALGLLGDGWDVVLCDLMMPRMSGMDVFDAARRHHPAEVEAFVFLTGGATSAEVEEFLDTCGRPVLMKPFRSAQLRATIDQAVLDRYA